VDKFQEIHSRDNNPKFKSQFISSRIKGKVPKIDLNCKVKEAYEKKKILNSRPQALH